MAYMQMGVTAFCNFTDMNCKFPICFTCQKYSAFDVSPLLKNVKIASFLAVQLLRLFLLSAGVVGLISG